LFDILFQTFDNGSYIRIYVGVTVVAVIVSLLSGLIIPLTGLRGAKRMHNGLLSTVIKVPTR